jgi:tetratricopeptide (TPR) repeat protein
VVIFTSYFLLLSSYLFIAPGVATLEARVAAAPEDLRVAAEYRQAVIAAGEYDRAIKFFAGLTKRPDAGPHAFLNLGLAYIDKIPSVGAFRRISLGNNATAALTHSIEREPSDLAYLIRGLVNLHFEKGLFHRTPDGVADLENALRLAAPHANRPYVARIYSSLGDGYWRLKNRDKARATWRDGQSRFPGDERLRLRLSSPDDVITDTIAHDLDAGVRVDTSLRYVIGE